MKEQIFGEFIKAYKQKLKEISELKLEIKKRKIGQNSDCASGHSFEEASKKLDERIKRSPEEIENGELKDLYYDLNYFKKLLLENGFSEDEINLF